MKPKKFTLFMLLKDEEKSMPEMRFSKLKLVMLFMFRPEINLPPKEKILNILLLRPQLGIPSKQRLFPLSKRDKNQHRGLDR